MKRQLRQQWRALAIALQFLTRLPAPLRGDIEPQDWGRSLVWYPAAGLLIGLLLQGLLWLLPANLPPLLGAAILVALWTWLSGALHLDGLADCADAWVGGMGDRGRTLAIMKDPSCGPMAAVVLVLALVLKVAAVMALLMASAGYIWLLPMLARALVAPAFLTTPYVRPAGLGSGLKEQLSGPAAGWSLAASGLLLILALPLAQAMIWLVLLVALFWWWRRAVIKRLGGFTGDCTGALIELAELLLLLAGALALGVR